jgi:hypothetical protein
MELKKFLNAENAVSSEINDYTNQQLNS